MNGRWEMVIPGVILAVGIAAGCRKETVIHAERKDLIETVYASGKIVPENESGLAALCNGSIVRKLVKDGDTVKKGQLLYLINAEAVIERADAALKNYSTAEANLSDRSPVLNDLRLSLENISLKCRNDSLVYSRWRQSQ